MVDGVGYLDCRSRYEHWVDCQCKKSHPVSFRLMLSESPATGSEELPCCITGIGRALIKALMTEFTLYYCCDDMQTLSESFE